jgi:hypothetical protein
LNRTDELKLHKFLERYFLARILKLSYEDDMSKSKRILCGVYILISAAATVLCWSQNWYYFSELGPAQATIEFIKDTWVTAASRSITIDIALFFLSAAIWMALEAKKHRIRFVWLYIIMGWVIGISTAFPLFLVARELTLDEKRL